MTCTEPLTHVQMTDLHMHIHRLNDRYTGLRDRVDLLDIVSKDTNQTLKITDHKVDQLIDFTDELTSRLNDHDRRFETIRAKLIEHDRRFELIDEKLAEHDKRFQAIDERFDAVDRRFEAVDKRFDAMDQKMDQGFAELDERFSELKALLVDALERKN